MKKSIIVFILTLVAVIYCFVIGGNSNAFFKNDATCSVHQESKKLDIPKEAISSVVSSNLFGQVSLIKLTTPIGDNTFSPSPLKKLFKPYWILTESVEQLFESKYIQYTIASINFSIQLRKTSLLFPSHYFW